MINLFILNYNHIIQKLKNNYNHTIINEAANDPRYTTYTIDKKYLHICLKTRDDNEHLYDLNTLMYVILHELAHLSNYDKSGNPIIGHGKEFQSIFKLYTSAAIDLNIYKYIDYSKNPKNYCGIIINTQILS